MQSIVKKWIETPAGSRASNPSWGHPLERFSGQEFGETLKIVMEMATINKIERDIPVLGIEGILIKPIGAEFNIKIKTSQGVFQGVTK